MTVSRFLYSLTNGPKHPEYSEYDYRKIIVINSFFILSIITLFLMGLVVLLYERLTYSACVNFLIISAIIILMIYFRISANYTIYKIVPVIISGLFFIYLVSTGGIADTGPLWSYIFPILSYFILGYKKGTAAILVEIFLFIIILFVPGIPILIADYQLYFKFRFILSTMFVSILAFSLEHARFNSFEKQEMLIIKLKSANDEIKELNNLIPICARCKKVRNDKGYWEQVESYLQKRAKISFTHSLCKECSDKLYGKEEWYRQK